MKKLNYKNLWSAFLLGVAVLSFSACNKVDNTPVPTPVADISTFAGNPVQGSVNGTGALASFYRPSGLAIDAQGNIYVADAGNNLIRKINPAGAVTTYAGTGAQGSTDGPAASATFNDPQGVAVDPAGNMYIADALNKLIRKISPTGAVTTLAGGGTKGTDGTGTAAGFDVPTGVAVDINGTIYVADNYLVRKITSAGVVSTLAGTGVAGSDNGLGTAASFNQLIGIAVDLNGNIYVADHGNNLIRKITRTGVVTTLAGSGSPGATDGVGTAASFSAPVAVATDAAGYVYVSDSNHLIRAIAPNGTTATLAGTGAGGDTDGGKDVATFSIPYGLAVGSGNLFIGDTFNNSIRRLTYK